MLSSGTTAIATTGAGNTVLIAAGGVAYNHLVVVNEGPVAGFVSIDKGTTWKRIPAATASVPGTAEIWERSESDVLIKRDGGTNMSAVYADAGWIDF